MKPLTDQSLQGQTIEISIQSLTAAFEDSSTPRLDAQVLISHVLKKPREWLLAHKEITLTKDQNHTLSQAVLQIQEGTPLPYILGRWPFYGLDFVITPAVLIPRPETELLVEHALKWLLDHPQRRQVIDVGTGSGCIAISLAHHISDLHITGLDISLDALEVAFRNAQVHQVDDRVTFKQADLFTPIPSTTDPIHPPCDLITTNLPYIPTTTLKNLKVYGREPTLALDGGLEGLDLIRKFLQKAATYLAPGGRILIEIEANQGEIGLKLACEYFSKATVRLYPDLSGNDRLLTIDT